MKNNRKGFTLAELLIVVAIIAVLVAIAIPVFSAQLEKAKQGADAANCRAVYAEAMVNALDNPDLCGKATSSAVMQSDKWDKLDASTKIGTVALEDIDKTKNEKIMCVVSTADGVTTVQFTEPAEESAG